LRWLDDTKPLRVKRWKLKAEDGKEWMVILREAMGKLQGA
jgi:hypothetical protein